LLVVRSLPLATALKARTAEERGPEDSRGLDWEDDMATLATKADLAALEALGSRGAFIGALVAVASIQTRHPDRRVPHGRELNG